MNKRPRIAVDGRGLLEPRGGLRRHAESVVALLPEVAPDLEWLVYHTRRTTAAATPKTVTWRYLPGSLHALLRPWWEDIQLPFALRRDHAEVLLSLYGIVPRNTPPVVAVAHDVVALSHPTTLAWHHRWYWRRVARRLPRATQVVVNSVTTGDAVCRHAGVNPARVSVAPLAAAAAFRPMDPGVIAAAEASLGLTLPYLLVVAGEGGPRKGLSTLGAAVAGLDNIELVVVGAALPAAPQLRFVGSLDDNTLAALMGGALAVACPSLTEGFGLPVVEAMACGAAVLAGAVGALPEVAGGAALLLPSGDVDAWRAAVMRLRTAPGLRSELARAGLARARQFSWEQTARRTVAAVREALEIGRRGR